MSSYAIIWPSAVRSLTRRGKQPGDDCFQILTELDFAQKGVSACFAAAGVDFRSFIEAHQDDACGGIAPADELGRSQSIHDGHADVHQHEVRMSSGDQRQGVGAVGSGANHFKPGHPGQKGDEAGSDVFGIIYNQGPDHPTLGRRVRAEAFHW
jgi:hypothetical protein